MELVFEITGGEEPALGQQTSKTFKQAGGLIGRSAKCEWVVLDSKSHISGEHAQISFNDGEFFLTDLSTNGTQIVRTGQNLRKGETHLIEHGNCYRLGHFEICARVIKDPAHFMGELDHRVYSRSIIPDDAFMDLALLNDLGDQDRFGLEDDSLLPTYAPQQASRQGVDYGPADRQNLLLPELVIEPLPIVIPVEPEDSVPQSEDFWQRFGTALGVDLTALDSPGREALAINAATLLKQSIGGLQQTLRTRSELKNQLRLVLSMAQHSGNNPLKYAGDASEAIGLLLQPQRLGQLPAEQAVARAFRDIQAHQVALLAASRAALRGALEHFAPRQLTLRFERDGKKQLFSTKAARWQAYERYHQTLSLDDDWSERLLARDFAQAYEEQVRLIATLHTGH